MFVAEIINALLLGDSVTNFRRSVVVENYASILTSGVTHNYRSLVRSSNASDLLGRVTSIQMSLAGAIKTFKVFHCRAGTNLEFSYSRTFSWYL